MKAALWLLACCAVLAATAPLVLVSNAARDGQRGAPILQDESFALLLLGGIACALVALAGRSRSLELAALPIALAFATAALLAGTARFD